MSEQSKIVLKRVYDEPEASDGTRVLVERLWPRGVSKERAGIDLWLKDVAPSGELRKWYSHDPAKFDEFRHRYEDELASEPAQTAVHKLRELINHGQVTLVFSSHDADLSNAAVLRDYLTRLNQD
jgi:uncharacterized protein YeaO (DUF488 family)